MKPTITSDLSKLGNADLIRSVNRAWLASVRDWSDYRREPARSPIKQMLLTAAMASQEWWEQLRDEQESRLTDFPAEDRSADVYTVQRAASPAKRPVR